MCFPDSDIPLHHFDMYYLSNSDSCKTSISQYPKLTITKGRTTLIFHVTPPPWYIVIDLMSLGVKHTAWNYHSPIISSSVEERHPERADVDSASLFFSHQRTEHFLLPTTTVALKHISQPYPTPNITDNYDPINITPFFNNILRLPSAMFSSRYCQTT